MIKLNLSTEDLGVITQVQGLSNLTVKSKFFYSGFDNWFTNKFIPGIGKDREIISCRDKRYDTLVGFTLLKTGIEIKFVI